MALLAGADGCNGGWVVATQDGDSAEPCCCVVTSIAEILQSRRDPDLVAIESAHPDIRDSVSEVHPEVSFRALAGRPMVASKKSREGQIERLELLEPIFGGALQRAITGCGKDGAKADDVVDAFVALWSAERIYNGSAVALPEECEIDRFGLGMQILA